MLKKYYITLIVIFILSSILHAQWVEDWKFDVAPTKGLAGNGVSDIVAGPNAIWFGTGNGLSRTTDNGQTFETFGPAQGLGQGSVSAIWTNGDTILVATANDTLTSASESYLDNGTGLSISVDRGETWRHIAQPPFDYTSVQNLSYDVTVLNKTIWLASFGGGLVRGDNFGETWVTAPPDSYEFSPGKRLNHRAFSVINADGALWVGTAEGINKSLDNGITWENFNHFNQTQPISGNFVTALAYQKTSAKKIIWACTWKAENPSEDYAISKTEDDGHTWQVMLKDIKASNFAFDGHIVYVATEVSLYKSDDFGQTWYIFPPITDTVTGERVYTPQVYSALFHNGVLWAGTADGLARTSNNGYSWDITRAFAPTGQGNVPRTYSYPNPFSSTRYNQWDGDGWLRLQYNTKGATTVTIKVYDFAMDLVATVADGKTKSGKGDYSEVWNCRNDYGDLVANGVYFYSVELQGDGTYWGKIMIVN